MDSDFKDKLAKVLKENLSLDIRFDERVNQLDVDIYFDKIQIASETVYLDHEHILKEI